MDKSIYRFAQIISFVLGKNDIPALLTSSPQRGICHSGDAYQSQALHLESQPKGSIIEAFRGKTR